MNHMFFKISLYVMVLTFLSLSVFLSSNTAFALSITIPVGSNPSGIVVNPATNTAYVANRLSNTVSVISGATNTVTDTIQVGIAPLDAAVNPVTNTIYVTNSDLNLNSHSVSVIDGSTNIVTNTITLPANSQPAGIAVNPVTDTIYVANCCSIGTVSVIDGSTNIVTNTITLPANSQPAGIAVNPTTNTIYVTNHFSTTVSVIDGSTNIVTNTIPVPGPNHPAVNPSTNLIYVPNGNSDSVSVIDGSTNIVTNTIQVGIVPTAAAVNPVTNTIYVSNLSSNTISVIDGATNNVIDTISVGTEPTSVAVNPLTNTVYVANIASDTVSVIESQPTTPSSKIVYVNDTSGIYSMNADGTGVTRLTTNAADRSPTWSPDGSKIAFHSTRDSNYPEIYTMNADGTGVTRLTTNNAANESPTWSPDGSKIAFDSTQNGNQDIYTMNPDGTGVTRLTTNAASDGSPDWSPDGSKIAFVSTRDNNFEIYTMNADGTGVTRLTTNAIDDEFPTWSPDGSKIAFDRYQGDRGIYTMNPDGTGVMRITYSLNFQPDWNAHSTNPISPTLVILSPGNHTTIFDNKTSVSGTASGVVSISSVTWKVDNGPVSVASTVDNFAHWSFNTCTDPACITTILSPGPHTIFVSAIDSSGLVTQVHLDVLIAPPGAAVQSLAGPYSVTFYSTSGGFSSLAAVSQSSLSTPPPPGSYPAGFFSWTVTGVPIGGSSTIIIEYPDALGQPSTVYEKLIGQTWYSIPVITRPTPNGCVCSVHMTLTDGASGQDADQAINGEISDPGAIFVSTSGQITGNGNIGKNADFEFEIKSKDGKTFKGELEYNDKHTHTVVHDTKMTFLSVSPDLKGASFGGNAKVANQDVKVLASVTDPDKNGNHDQFSITISDSSGKIIYHNSGTVKGHVEIHKLSDSDKK